MNVLVVAATLVSLVGASVAGAFWLDDRHTSQIAFDEQLGEFKELAGWVKKESIKATNARAEVEDQIKRDKLNNWKIIGRCVDPKYKALCENWEQQLDRNKRGRSK